MTPRTMRHNATQCDTLHLPERCQRQCAIGTDCACCYTICLTFPCHTILSPPPCNKQADRSENVFKLKIGPLSPLCRTVHLSRCMQLSHQKRRIIKKSYVFFLLISIISGLLLLYIYILEKISGFFFYLFTIYVDCCPYDCPV